MTNPERLCAHVEMDSTGLVVDFTVADISRIESLRESGGPHGSPLSAVEYIRADVAAEQTAAALRGEAHEVAALRAEVEALREALRKVQVCCQYKGTQQILMVAVDVKAIVHGALAAKGVG